MFQCAELERLKGESSRLFAEYEAVRDELKMLKKTDSHWQEQKKALGTISGQLNEAHKRVQQHIKDHGCR